MKRIGAIATAITTAALLAAACGAGGGRSAMVAKCVKQGQSQKTCQCIVDKTEKNVDKDVFRAMMLDAEGKTEESQKLMQGLPADKQMSAKGALSALECINPN